MSHIAGGRNESSLLKSWNRKVSFAQLVFDWRLMYISNLWSISMRIKCVICVLPLSFYLQAQQLIDAPMWQESSPAAAVWWFTVKAFSLCRQGFLPFVFNDAHTWLWWCEVQQGAAITGDRKIEGCREEEKRALFIYLKCSGFFWNYEPQWS